MQVAPAEKTIATSEPKPAAHSPVSTPSPSPERKFCRGGLDGGHPPLKASAGSISNPRECQTQRHQPLESCLPRPPARVVAPSNLPASSVAALRAQQFRSKASSASWVTACADGAKVFAKLFNNGDRWGSPASRGRQPCDLETRAALQLARGQPVDRPDGSVGAGPDDQGDARPATNSPRRRQRPTATRQIQKIDIDPKRGSRSPEFPVRDLAVWGYYTGIQLHIGSPDAHRLRRASL